MAAKPDTTAARGALIAGALAAVGAAVSVHRNIRTVGRIRRILPLEPAPPASELPGRAVAPVTAIVPARNEESVIDDCVRGLRSQTYGAGAEDHPLRIVVVDDDSTDATSAIVGRHAAADPRVSAVRTTGPPPGWAGKVHAMHAGVEAAGPALPDGWLLFVDADTVLSPVTLDRLIATAEAADADLVSMFAGPPEQPGLAWPLLLPPGLQMVGENAEPDGKPGHKAFAIGHCILVRRKWYDTVGGWEALKSLRNEDIAFATRVRDLGGTTNMVDSQGNVTTTGMDPFGQGWTSFRKSFVAGTKGSLFILIGGGVGQIVLSLAAPSAVLTGLAARNRPIVALGVAGWVAQAVGHLYAARVLRAGHALAPLAPFTGALFGAVLVDGAIKVIRGTSGWKGRPDRLRGKRGK